MPRSPKKAPPASAGKERRPVQYRAKCPAKLAERLHRAATQRLYLVEREEVDESSESCAFTVLGSTGNVYTVTLEEIPSCTCPDFAKKQDLCKHMLFVYLKVIGLSPSNPLAFQKGYVRSELQELFGMINDRRVGGAVLANDTVRQNFARLQSGEEVEGEETAGVQRRSLEEDCPICFDSLQSSATTYCRGQCGGNMHLDCWRRWKARQSAPTCPLCRTPWMEAGGPSSPANKEGYVNLGRLQGQSPVRDTSTYHRSKSSPSSGFQIGLRRHPRPSSLRKNNAASERSSAIGENPTKLESVVANAKALLFLKNDEKSKEVKNKFFASSAAGLAVALAMVPEAVAFSFVAGVNPLVGLWTTVTLGFFAATFGGRAGICSSASGACSVVVASLCRTMGPEYVSLCALMAGLFQIIGGVLGLGKFIRLVPHPVMLGFVNGLAVVMTKAQLHHFQGIALGSPRGLATIGITGVTMILVKLLPKLTKVIPPSLGAVAIATVVSNVFQLPVETLTDIAGAETFAGGWQVLPKFGLPSVPFNVATLSTVAPVALTMAAVGVIESLLTMQLVDGMMDDGKKGSTTAECVGQGVGNVVSGLVGGIGGCALLGLSIINVQSGGGVSRWSGISMALFLAAGIIAAAPLLGSVPLASLVGVMLLVCYSTFSWSSLRLIGKIPKLDTAVIALVSLIVVQKDLAQAVLAGTIASALGFAWKQSTNLSVATTTTGDSKVYQLTGPLFFGSTNRFQSLFAPKTDPTTVVLDLGNSRVFDHSALEAIQALGEKYQAAGKTLVLKHLSEDSAKLLARHYTDAISPPSVVVESDPLSDPVYQIFAESDVYNRAAPA